ncbi:hypothetical protein HPB47_026649 [Ixodes persulcatus]|uniref:Uncharacterized protein n=1 Tax=Ixodes persulcatus TaxID=34615 RepID=A0AC60PZC9_IXOPE|nr:hypothetical protein HPB47_026649 [Ixodes persulcatus]
MKPFRHAVSFQYDGRYPYFILNENEYTNRTNNTTESHEKIPTTVVMVAISTIVATLKTLVMYGLYFTHLQYLGEIAADNLRRWGGHDYPRQPETSTGRDFGKEAPDPWRPADTGSESSRRPSAIDYDVGRTRSVDSYRPAGTEREPPYPPSQRPEPQSFYPPVPGPPAVPPPGPWPVPQASNYPAVPQAIHQPVPPSNYTAAPSPVQSPAYQQYFPAVQAVPPSYSPAAHPALPSPAYPQSPLAVHPAVPQPLPGPPPPPPPAPPQDDSFPRAPSSFKWPPLFINRS